jgi:hypothetical protein
MPADQQLYQRALSNAVRVTGGEDALREYLDVPSTTLRTWLTGLKPIPENVFLKVIDLLLDPKTPPITRFSRVETSKPKS